MIATDKYTIIKIEEFEKYELTYRIDNTVESNEIVLKSLIGKKNKAVYKNVNILDESGKFLYKMDINNRVAEFIFDNFKARGEAESFNIYLDDLNQNQFSGLRSNSFRSIKPRHVLTEQEKSYTSEGEKLKHHAPIFSKLASTGYGSIIRATLTNHQVCASNCQFCSTIARNKKDAVSLQEAKDFVDALYFEQANFNRKHFPEFNQQYINLTGSDIRLKGLILSGGGQPNLWPHFSELVEYLSELDIDLGLITNGFPKHIDEDIYTKFKWIRISITPEDASPFYPEKRFDKQYIPGTIKNNPAITVGYSYVFGPWTEDDILNRIDESMREYGFDYCRTLTDCNLSRDAQINEHRNLAERLFRLNFIDDKGNPTGKIFHQLKYHGTKEEALDIWDQGQCWLQSYNVFWDTTGHEENGFSYCYPCDSVTVLTEESDGNIVSSERKFNYEKWGTVKNTDVSKLYKEPLKSYFDPRENCTSCLFMKNNLKVKELKKADNFTELADLDSDIKHVNFP